MSDVSEAILRLCPEAEFSVLDNDPSKIEWIKPEEESDRPSIGQIETELEVLDALAEENAYKNLRRDEYPPLEDLADAIYWQANGNEEPMSAYLLKCEEVKNKYPKPE